MRRTIMAIASLTVMTAVVVAGSIAMAAKPQEVIEMSNGYPSGAHFNLNIHGKKDGFTGDSTSGGSSVFVSEYGESTIQYVSNKKASLTELTVLDSLAEAFDGDPAKVQLPHESQGYYVFARIHGRPNNGSTDGDPSSIILYPNPVLEACNDTDPANPDFPTYTDCPDDPLLALGLVTTQGVYELTEQGFERFDDASTSKGKGRSKATDITGLFLWTGWVVDASLDTNGPDGVPDGVIDILDVPEADYDGDALTDPNRDYNNDGLVNGDDVHDWLTDVVLSDPTLAEYFDNEWVFNVADLVIQDQTITNDGTKLLQVRFYPVATTEFVR
jgi:hypothetical protein